MSKNSGTIVFLATFSLFMTEAIIHYNLGVKEADPNKKGLQFPPPKDLMKLALVVGVFSAINGVVV